MWWERFARSLQCVASSTSCARRPQGVGVRLHSPMVLSTHGSGRARGEREEQKAWASAKKKKYHKLTNSFPQNPLRLRSL